MANLIMLPNTKDIKNTFIKVIIKVLTLPIMLIPRTTHILLSPILTPKSIFDDGNRFSTYDNIIDIANNMLENANNLIFLLFFIWLYYIFMIN